MFISRNLLNYEYLIYLSRVAFMIVLRVVSDYYFWIIGAKKNISLEN